MNNFLINVTGNEGNLEMHLIQAHCSNAPIKTAYDPFTEEEYKYYDNEIGSSPTITDWTQISPEACKVPLSFNSLGILDTEVLRIQYLRVSWFDTPPTSTTVGIPQYSGISYRGTAIIDGSGGFFQTTDPNWVIVYLYTPEGLFGGFGTVYKATEEEDPNLYMLFAIPWDDFQFFLEHTSDYEEKVEEDEIPETGINYDPFSRGSGDLKGDQGKGSFAVGGDFLGFTGNDSYGHHLYTTNSSGRDQLVELLFRQDTQTEVSEQDLVTDIFDKILQESKFNKYLPEQGILSTHILPKELTPTSSGPSNGIRSAGVVLPVSGVYYASSQQTYIDFDSINIDEMWGNAFDYENCRIYVYLPFCGTVNITPSAVLDGNIQISYYCDAPTGDVTAAVYTTGKNGASQLITSASGNCAYKIPIVAQSSNSNALAANSIQQVSNILSTLIALNVGVKTGGGLSGNIGMTLDGNTFAQGTFLPQLGNLIGKAAFGKQYQTTTSGSVGGDALTCDKQIKIYLEQTVPVYPKNYENIISKPTYGGGTVKEGVAYTFGGEQVSIPYSGYTKYQFVDASGISSATDEEKAEIQRILTEEGIYL